MTKFEQQAADLGGVYLYKEGLFVRAYNEGAYAFIHQVLACKPMRRFVKSAGSDRVVCGVPFTVLAGLPGFASASQRDALTWRWPLAAPVDSAAYAVWRDSLPLQATNPSATKAPPPVAETPAQRVLAALLEFNVATSTPMAALNLVADLQRQWQESEVA